MTVRSTVPYSRSASPLRPISAALIAAGFILAGSGATAAPLAAHHAVYRLSLGHPQDGAKEPAGDTAVTEAHGTMTYDVGDTCSAWTTAQHLVIDLVDADGQAIHMVSDYATLESKDGAHLDFHTRQVKDDAVTEQLDGSAVLDHPGAGGHADFTSPEKRRVPLPAGTLLPMAHTNALLDAAAAGKKFVSVPLFDGTTAAGAQDTFVAIESWHVPASRISASRGAGGPHADGASWPALAAHPSGRVHIAFFDRDQTGETPDYEIGMQYFDNGVADSLTMDFGDFKMDGKLQSLDMRPAHC